MKRIISISISLLLVAVLGGTGVLWLLERQHYETTDNAYLKTNMVLISAKVAGYVTKLAIDDNQLVKQGQILLEIDDRDYQARLQQARAAVETEVANLQRLQAMKQSQQARIEAARANINLAAARLDSSQKDLHRFTNLAGRGSAATRLLDQAESESRQRQAESKGYQAALMAEQAQINSLNEEMNAAQSRLKLAQAQVTLAQLDLEHTKVRAPFTGIIGKRGVQLGQLVQPGLSLAYLIENQNVWLEANFKETQLEFMRVGQPAKIKIDAYSELVLEGTVASFAPSSGSEFSLLPPENATGNFTKIVRRVPVKITFNPGAYLSLLKGGLSAEVEVKVKENKI